MEDPATAPEGDAAGDVIRVEEDVVRDLRHSIGNHFHKLYYWADRMGSEPDSDARGEQAKQLERAIQRLQHCMDLALRYFEPDRASLVDAGGGKVAQSLRAMLSGEMSDVALEVQSSSEVDAATVRLDPQRFSAAVRLVVELLRASAGEKGTCRVRVAVGDDALLLSCDIVGEATPAEAPVMEWAIAKKAMAMQGGTLQLSGSARAPNGCVLKLPRVS
ncbi:MAG: hypothetical protein FJ144_10390 [Deltaproteobacteria bacterium]|nr:hypothetical protein [Deltaproteobacteria bacterium]